MARYRLNSDGAAWSIYTPAAAPGDRGGETYSAESGVEGLEVPMLNFLLEKADDPSLAAHANKLIKFLTESVPQLPRGPWALPRVVDKHFDARVVLEKGKAASDVTFFRFRSGDLRVVFVKSGRSVVVCTQAYIKRGQEVLEADKQVAIRAYQGYVAEFGANDR